MSEKYIIRVVIIGQDGHGRTTLTAALGEFQRVRGMARHTNFDQLDQAQMETIAGNTFKISRLGLETERYRYEIVDCPTHSDCLTFLSLAASNIAGAILVVSATDGVMPHTTEQLQQVHRLGLDLPIVYLNMCDQVDDDDALSMVEDEVRACLDRVGYDSHRAVIVRGSALQALNGEDSDLHLGQSSILKLLQAMDESFPSLVSSS